MFWILTIYIAGFLFTYGYMYFVTKPLSPLQLGLAWLIIFWPIFWLVSIYIYFDDKRKDRWRF